MNIRKKKEESGNSREFWMFIGALVMFLAAIFIIAKTSVPVYNKIFGTSIAGGGTSSGSSSLPLLTL